MRDWFPIKMLAAFVIFIAVIFGLLYIERYDPFSSDAPYVGKISRLWVEPRTDFYFVTVELSNGGSKKVWSSTRELWGTWTEGDRCRFVATERVIRSAECFVEAK